MGMNPEECEMVKRPEGVQKIFYSWDEYLDLIHSLGKLLEGQRFDFIVAIKRGGWILGVILSHRLGVRLFSVDELRLLNFSSAKLRELKILVVDEIVDTGGTLEKVLRGLRGCGEVKIAVLHRKPWTKVEPDYFVKSTERWICYPYEVGEE